jgi:hypothetical protein
MASFDPEDGGSRVARVVGVHGIAQQYKGGYELLSVWFDSLRDGLVAADAETIAHALVEQDLHVSFFGDYFRPAGSMAAGTPPYSAADITPGPERELLVALYDAAATADSSLAPPENGMASGKIAVQIMLSRLLRSKTFAGVAQKAFIGNLKQVTKFMDNALTKDQVLDRIHQTLTPDTTVLIGHSLGSIAAYEYLCRYRPASVQLLITLGCPLGIPRLVFDKLTPRPVNGAGAWPGTIASWVNVADPDDIVALRKDLSGLFPPAHGVSSIGDRLVDNGDAPHAIARYLNARETGQALAAALA